MKIRTLLLLFCVGIFTKPLLAQHQEMDKLDSIIRLANKSFLDEDKNLNYLKPYQILIENSSVLEPLDSYAKSHYVDNLEVVSSFLKTQNPYKEIIGGSSLSEAVSTQNPYAFLEKEIEGQRLFMLNEAHDTPEHRLFATSLLDLLYAKGFRYLALEALSWEDEAINQRGFPISSSGYYLREAYFADFVRRAIALGFTILPYEQKPGSGRSINERETNQANHLIHYLNEMPNSKIFVYAGYAHIQKKSAMEDIKWMAERVKDSLDINFLSVDQTNLSKSQEKEVQLVSLRNQDIDEALTLFEGVYDALLHHPSTNELLQERLGKEKFSINFEELSFNTDDYYLLQFYQAKEYKNFGDAAIPIEQILLKENTQEVFLKPASYLVVLRDRENKVIYRIEKSFVKTNPVIKL